MANLDCLERNAEWTPYQRALRDAQDKLARSDWSRTRKANLRRNFLAVWGVKLSEEG